MDLNRQITDRKTVRRILAIGAFVLSISLASGLVCHSIPGLIVLGAADALLAVAMMI